MTSSGRVSEGRKGERRNKCFERKTEKSKVVNRGDRASLWTDGLTLETTLNIPRNVTRGPFPL